VNTGKISSFKFSVMRRLTNNFWYKSILIYRI
jgi:hypothetical protein